MRLPVQLALGHDRRALRPVCPSSGSQLREARTSGDYGKAVQPNAAGHCLCLSPEPVILENQQGGSAPCPPKR
jgi:hypothetical protein